MSRSVRWSPKCKSNARSGSPSSRRSQALISRRSVNRRQPGSVSGATAAAQSRIPMPSQPCSTERIGGEMLLLSSASQCVRGQEAPDAERVDARNANARARPGTRTDKSGTRRDTAEIGVTPEIQRRIGVTVGKGGADPSHHDHPRVGIVRPEETRRACSLEDRRVGGDAVRGVQRPKGQGRRADAVDLQPDVLRGAAGVPLRVAGGEIRPRQRGRSEDRGGHRAPTLGTLGYPKGRDREVGANRQAR